MRVLLQDKTDSTLMVVEATDVCYDKDSQTLCVYVNDTCFSVERMIQSNADAAIRGLFATGMADLTMYPASED